jgi:hypothetical protein
VRADASVAAFQSHFGGLGHIRGGDRVDDWLVRFCFRLWLSEKPRAAS